MVCMARALMSYCPAGLDNTVEFMRWLLDRPELLDKWIEMRGGVLGAEEQRYVFVSSDGWGKSCARLSDGVRAEAAFRFRGEWSVRALFREMARNYLRDIAPINEENRARIERFTRMVAACDEGYGGECVASFRDRLARHGEHPIPGRPEQVVVLPEQLIGFCQDVAKLRADHAADAHLMGSMGTAADICMAVAGGEDRGVFASEFDVFSRYAWFITSGKELHPVRILDSIAQQAIREGFVSRLVQIADNYRERVNSKIEAGSAARDIDAHLDRLYEALPYAHGVHNIYSRLVRFASEASDDERQRFRGAEQNADETLVRISMPFVNQVLDFGGHNWALHKKAIDRARRVGGEPAASEQARVYVDRLLYYPETTLGLLLDP